ncbi:MAG: sensor histidine kinase [Marinifilaceae bacterium]|nr:sensor histidine kinase [Marinifilaceae bacterium]
MEDKKIKDGFYQIRPAGRHIITIGRDLIKDKYAAIVELVKNAYDADSPTCKVKLEPFENENNNQPLKGLKITISDEGHGMSFDIVTEKWMVPSTDDKLQRIISPKGRLMQGKKGIGRYSASMLGDDLVLQTVDESGDLTTLYLIWEYFEKAKYLSDVNVLIENFKSNRKSGTEIIIVGDESHLIDWDEKQLQKLKFELKKLIPPIDSIGDKTNVNVDRFKISLELGNFPFESFSNTKEDIEPYPLFELFDYRISGTISHEGIADLKYENKRSNTPSEDIRFKISLNNNVRIPEYQEYCGKVRIDFSVFDRDPISIDGLIERGLKDPATNNYVGKAEARRILDNYCGIGVFRNGFRIRPLGDSGFDWLNLDKERVQNPTIRIGSDQIIGFIHIESEKESGLIEKSARDGLKENPAYFGLMNIAITVLKELENRRFAYRRNIGLGRNNRNISEKIDKLYNFSDLFETIHKELDGFGIEKVQQEKINRILLDKEKINNKIAEELKQSIALYQGQATVGKIVNVILHEGRRPLSYFKNQVPVIASWSGELKDSFSEELLEKIRDRLSVFSEQGGVFINLFGKLDPLSAKKRGSKSKFKIKEVINSVFDVFTTELNDKNIDHSCDCEANKLVFGWKEDFYIVFTNLVDNSIFWLQENGNNKKEIKLKIYDDDENLIIEYRDNGPGIKKEYIESEVIFEPEFSDKPGGGTGLGLAIAGEAIARNNGELKAIYSESGVLFKIEIKSNKNELTNS